MQFLKSWVAATDVLEPFPPYGDMVNRAVGSAIYVLGLVPTIGYMVLRNRTVSDLVNTVAILLRGLSGLSVPSVVVWTKAIPWWPNRSRAMAGYWKANKCSG